MLKKFDAYQLALKLYEECKTLSPPRAVKDQLDRASLSIVLNLAEGSGKPTTKDQRRFYAIALGSCRETQAMLEILKAEETLKTVDRVGGCLYRLVYPK
jgi:four helix bundle protein